VSPSVAHDRSLLIPYDTARDSHANDAPLPVPACHPRDCQSSRLSVRTHRPRQITVGGRATIGGMPRNPRRARRLRRRSVDRTHDRANDHGGWRSGRRTFCERWSIGVRGTARRRSPRDRPRSSSRRATCPAITSVPMGGRSPDFATIRFHAAHPWHFCTFRDEHRRWRTGPPALASPTRSRFCRGRRMPGGPILTPTNSL